MMQQNPEYTNYVCRFNVLYHDYKYTTEQCAIALGPEPPQFIEAPAKRLVAIGDNSGVTAVDPALRTLDSNAIDYGLIKHRDPGMLVAIENTLAQGYTPNEIGATLSDSSSLLPSEIREIVGAAKFIAKTAVDPALVQREANSWYTAAIAGIGRILDDLHQQLDAAATDDYEATVTAASVYE